MTLTYFQHPYDALTKPLMDHVMSRDQEVGVSASVLVEKSTQHFLLSLDPHLFRYTNTHIHMCIHCAATCNIQWNLSNQNT